MLASTSDTELSSIQGKKKSVPTAKGNALKTILENETTQTVHPLIEGFDLGCYW